MFLNEFQNSVWEVLLEKKIIVKIPSNHRRYFPKTLTSSQLSLKNFACF